MKKLILLFLSIIILNSCVSFKYNAKYESKRSNGVKTTYIKPTTSREPNMEKNLKFSLIGLGLSSAGLAFSPEGSVVNEASGIGIGVLFLTGLYTMGHYTGNLSDDKPLTKGRTKKWAKSIGEDLVVFSSRKGKTLTGRETSGLYSVTLLPAKYTVERADPNMSIKDQLIVAELFPDERLDYLNALGAKEYAKLDGHWLGPVSSTNVPSGEGRLYFFNDPNDIGIFVGYLENGEIKNGTIYYENKRVDGNWKNNLLHGKVHIWNQNSEPNHIEIYYSNGSPIGLGKGYNRYGKHIYDVLTNDQKELKVQHTHEYAQKLEAQNEQSTFVKNIGGTLLFGAFLSYLFSSGADSGDCSDDRECRMGSLCCIENEIVYRGIDGNNKYCECD